MQKVRFIYNPKSGETVISEWLDHIIEIYQGHGYTVVPYRLCFGDTEETDMFDGVDQSYHHALIAGGDGTVNYVVNVMKRRGLDVPVAVLPTGTANDFAHVLGVPSEPWIWGAPTTNTSSTCLVVGCLPTFRRKRRRS